MIDTHAHIYLPEFDIDQKEMIARAKAAGVTQIYLPNIDVESIAPMLALSEQEKGFCFPMMGLHPCSVGSDYFSVLASMETLIEEAPGKFYGIGECGLDYYWDKTFIAEQHAAFERQILMAIKYQLPLIIHSRDAMDDCLALVEKHQGPLLRGIFHCFSGTEAQLDRVIALGFYAGIGGVATFKNGGLDKVLRPAHLPNLVLETDAPYLAPVPFRGKRNEPAYLTHVVQRISEITDVAEADVIAVTTGNAEKLFGN